MTNARPQADAQKAEVKKWATYLDTIRKLLLESDGKLTMTKLYNELSALRAKRDSSHRAYPVLIAHERLGAAVAAAHGWEWPLEDDTILERLLVLNLERAAQESSGSTLPDLEPTDNEAAA
jgi:hypothetical protein